MQNKDIIITKNGRFGNQLYYMLNAYKYNKKIYLRTNHPLYKETIDAFQKLNLNDLLTYDSNGYPIQTVFQNFKKQFNRNDLESFIKNKILKSEYFNKNIDLLKLNEKDIVIHIRCGDYLMLQRYMFDRNYYFEKAFQKISNRDSIKLIVQSDDINYCKNNYIDIFNKYFKNIEFYDKKSMLEDFIHLCLFKNKIIMNSTFAIWSAFISNVIFENSYQNIICPNVFFSDEDINQKINCRYDLKWNFVFL